MDDALTGTSPRGSQTATLQHVLKDIDLTIDQSEVVVVIGPSGAGKSTLCRTINRLETFESGTITIDGQLLPTDTKALARLRADVGMVFQSFNLFAHRTVLQNVTLGPIKVRGSSKDVAAAKAMQLLERVGVKDQANNVSQSLGHWRWNPRSCSSTSRPRR
jgi:glutamate transport system ATP-binding protein